MAAIIFEHVPLADLPQQWREKFGGTGTVTVTVRIEEEALTSKTGESGIDDPAFGLWRDREDMANVADYVRKIRLPRYNRDGTRNQN
jgi:hypothetical protein